MDEKDVGQVAEGQGADQGEVDNSKRNIMAALMGSLGVAALAGCTNHTGGTEGDKETIGRVAEAIQHNSGQTPVRWCQTIAELRSGWSTPDWPLPQTGDVCVLEGYWNAGDGGGGLFYWDAASNFGDDGGTVIRPLISSELGRWKRIYSGPLNVKWFGARGDLTSPDRDAIQATLNAAAGNGAAVFIPAGAYLVAGPLTIEWSVGSTPVITDIHGSGYSTQIVGQNIPADRAVFEITGAGNIRAVNEFKIHDLKVLHDSSCSASAYCLLFGDSRGFSAERIWLEGINCLAIKCGLGSSEAQIDTAFRSCTFLACTNGHAVNQAPGSSSVWDNVRFDSCIFREKVWTRATLVEFDNCQFLTNSPMTESSISVEVRVGAATLRNCYFENHYAAIKISAAESHVKVVSIHGCYFFPTDTVNSQCAIWIDAAAQSSVGLVHVSDCTFLDYAYSAGPTPGSIINGTTPASAAKTLIIEGAVNCDSSSTPLDAPIRVHPAATSGFPVLDRGRVLVTAGAATAQHTERVRWRRTTDGTNDFLYGIIEGMTSHGVHLSSRKCWLSKLTLLLDTVATQSVVVGLQVNTAPWVSTQYTQNFDRTYASGTDTGYRLNPAPLLVINRNHQVTVSLSGCNSLPAGTTFVIEAEFSF